MQNIKQKYGTSELIYKTETDSQTERELMVTRGRWEWVKG